MTMCEDSKLRSGMRADLVIVLKQLTILSLQVICCKLYVWAGVRLTKTFLELVVRHFTPDKPGQAVDHN